MGSVVVFVKSDWWWGYFVCLDYELWCVGDGGRSEVFVWCYFGYCGENFGDFWRFGSN